MKTLYLTQSGTIALDSETQKPCSIYPKIESIRNVYLITEPTKIVYSYGEKTEELYAEADDIVILFYRDDFKHNVVVAKSAGWVENIKDYDEKEQKRKEEWAAKQGQNLDSIQKDCECTCPPSAW